ncbi:contact-dependent growth inhibition system immunity protein [Streptomyces sp. NPDC090306]|uniref:contact-dependent growth inhibition system immunity protein n=1 Tax=unclassified Streptomyces TaxID=2593676 RepID=UPI0036E239A2
MNHETPSWQRFYELSDLLEAYASADFTFADTAEVAGPGLASYLRIAAREPSRASKAIEQIDDLLSVGLFSEEIAEDVETMPHIRPPLGSSVEDCLRIARRHLVRLLQDPSQIPPAHPQTSWEWHERFPRLGQLLGAYFNQEFSSFYTTRDEALNEYIDESWPEDSLMAAQEIGELLTMVTSDRELARAASALGLALLPPDGMTLRQWLQTVREKILGHGRPVAVAKEGS